MVALSSLKGTKRNGACRITLNPKKAESADGNALTLGLHVGYKRSQLFTRYQSDSIVKFNLSSFLIRFADRRHTARIKAHPNQTTGPLSSILIVRNTGYNQVVSLRSELLSIVIFHASLFKTKIVMYPPPPPPPTLTNGQLTTRSSISSKSVAKMFDPPCQSSKSSSPGSHRWPR